MHVPMARPGELHVAVWLPAFEQAPVSRVANGYIRLGRIVLFNRVELRCGIVVMERRGGTWPGISARFRALASAVATTRGGGCGNAGPSSSGRANITHVLVVLVLVGRRWCVHVVGTARAEGRESIGKTRNIIAMSTWPRLRDGLLEVCPLRDDDRFENQSSMSEAYSEISTHWSIGRGSADRESILAATSTIWSALSSNARRESMKSRSKN